MIGGVFTRFAAVLKDGVRIWWLAPLIPALVVVPEFIQHVAEIQIGMFDSREAARALSDDPRRMVWGYAKVAGLVLAILAAARFWGARATGTRWWDLRTVRWSALALAFGLMLVTSIPEWLLKGRVSDEIGMAITLAITLLTLPLLVMLVAALVGDGSVTLRSAFRTGWLPAIRMLVFAAALWVPLQWLHGKNHEWAMGQDSALVWALMVFDSLVVGMLAMMAGTAFHHGYADKNRIAAS